MALPKPEDIFATYFAPWYPQEEHDDGNVWLRPDFEEIELPPGVHIRELDRLTAEGKAIAHQKLRGMAAAARTDWPALLKVSGEPSVEWLEAFDNWATDDRLEHLYHSAMPEQPANPILLLTCEAGVVIGDLLCQAHPSAQWIPDLPYWDSVLFDLNRGARLYVFSWIIRRLGQGGCETPLAARYETALKLLRGGMEET